MSRKEGSGIGKIIEFSTPIIFLGLLSLAAVRLTSIRRGFHMEILDSDKNSRGIESGKYVHVPNGTIKKIGLFKRDAFQTGITVETNKTHGIITNLVNGKTIANLTPISNKVSIFSGDIQARFFSKNKK